MSDLSILFQGLVDHGTSVASAAELILVWKLLQSAENKDGRVSKIERIVDSEVQEVVNLLREIQKDIAILASITKQAPKMRRVFYLENEQDQG